MGYILENDVFRLSLGEDAKAESLILKANGEECLSKTERLPFFSLTEERPYHNEVKLAHPTKRTTFRANRLRMEEGRLVVGFELIDFEAVVEVKIAPAYMVFTLSDFLVRPDSFGIGVSPIRPPVCEFRLVQLPVATRARFGEWLNVMWDDRVAVNVLSACPYPRIAAEDRRDHKILFGETLKEVKLKGAGVALIVSEPGRLLDAIDALEQDFDLPRGVESRRSPLINRSYYWAGNVNPKTVDEHIAFALRGGFRFMCIVYSSILYEEGGYRYSGQYDTYREEYPNGRADLVAMLDKIRAAGIIPGLHMLHAHVGLRTKYLTPVADHRLNLSHRFTLAGAVEEEDTVLYVEENPENAPTFEKHRVLRFMGELIRYESFTAERPYRFLGCERGFNGTHPRAHEAGTMGGVLDISEFAGNSAYVDQRTSLQDEIADRIADLYGAGFQFLYFDGSEGTNPPFDVNVGLAQWRVYQKLEKKPIFCEGAAKSHFSWHMLSGGNAFDVWDSARFKEMIVKHPYAEVFRMANDFTRLNFGWWMCKPGQRPDILEYGTALAAACGCPGSFAGGYGNNALQNLRAAARTDDMLETLRRWEMARECGFVTDAVRAELQKTDIEHTLLINEEGELELAAWEMVEGVAGGDASVTAFLMERRGKTYAVCWHNTGEGVLRLFGLSGALSYKAQLGGEEIPVRQEEGSVLLPIAEKRYLATDMPLSLLRQALAGAILIPAEEV